MQDVEAFAFGRFRMDVTRRVLLVDGQAVALHARAFDILEYLVASRERVVTRDEIVGHVWRGVVVGENNLSVQMSTLRRVLAAHGGADLIVTVPHRGYQFVEGAAEAPVARPAVDEPRPSEIAAEPAKAADRRRSLRHWIVAGMGVLAVLAALTAAWWPSPKGSQVASDSAPIFDPPPHSVAVLAFSNLSGEPAQDYLSDGMSEELIEALSQIRQMRVTARTSSFYFKNKPSTIKDIARALDVASVVEGSVRRQGSHLRIEARLTDSRTGFETWSQTFDSELGDFLKVEADIAAAVAGAMKVTLVPGDSPDRNPGGTANADALDAYLRGVQHIRHDSVQSYRAALADFDAAIAADRDFALAYSGKADAQVLIYNNQDATDPAWDRGKEADISLSAAALTAGRRGVELAPANGSTHIALANVLDNALEPRHAWAEAKSAEALSPGNATIDLVFSFVALTVGHRDEAMRAALRAIELDPLREDSWLSLGQQYRVAQDYDQAFKAYQHAQALAGKELPLIAYERALAYIAMGNPQRALDVSLGGSDWTHMECRAIALHALGRQHEAEQVFATFLKQDGLNFNYVYAEIFAQWRQPADALSWLEKAKAVKDSGLSIIKFDPMMDPIRGEPGFKAIEASLDFPE